MTTMMTMTNIFQTMKQYMDESTKTSAYMVQELKSNGMVYTSYFDSKKKALVYARRICDESSTIYIYKSYCMKIYDPVDDMRRYSKTVVHFTTRTESDRVSH